MDNRSIGVFDSGIGGLTAVRELKLALPKESILYFGDTGRVPYGTRSKEIIAKYAKQDINFLLSNNVKVIIAACGTVSSAAGNVLNSLAIPHINVIDPTALAAANATRNGKIGVIATTATIKSNAFVDRLLSLDTSFNILQQACPLLVPLVENGYIDSDEPVTKMVLERYLCEIITSGVDTLIMGCTHYPIIEKIIATVMGNKVTLIDSGRETARHCVNILHDNNLLCSSSHTPEYKYYVSDSVQGFHDIAGLFLETEIGDTVSRIDIEKY